jgi:CBS-domain-containing membrane protein
MKVQDIMTANPAFCHRETNLAEVAALMWQHNCGALPVLDKNGSLVGVITDRDVCIALGTRNRVAAEVSAAEVITGRHFTCGPDDNIRHALQRMQDNQVRRLPVVDREEHLRGIISIDDIVLNAQWAETHVVDLSFLDVIRVLRRVTYPAAPCAGSEVCPVNRAA